MQQQRGRIDDNRRDARSGLENESEEQGDKKKGEEEKVRCEVFAFQDKSFLPGKLHEDWGGKDVEYGLGLGDSVARRSCRYRACREAEVEEAAGPGESTG